MGWCRRSSWLVLGVAMAIATGAGCSKDAPPTPTVPTSVVETEVPAPATLLAEVSIPTPNATWAKLQRNIGGVVGILPSSFGGLVATLTGLELGFADEVDGVAPAYAALGAPAVEGSAVSFVIATKLVELRRVRALLLAGDTSKFKAREEGSLTYLTGPTKDYAMALTASGYLLVGGSEADIAALGPYAYRTLPKRAPANEAVVVTVPKASLRGPLRSQLLASWAHFMAEKLEQDEQMRKAHGGRAPDFADPKGILSVLDAVVQKRAQLLEHLDGATLRVETLDTRLRGTVSLSGAAADPVVKSGLVDRSTGDASTLLGAPSDAAISLFFHDDAAEREKRVEDLVADVGAVFGKRLGDAETKRARDIAAAWSKARGDALRCDVYWADQKHLGLQTQGGKADELDRAGAATVDLLRAPFFKEPLKLKSLDAKPQELSGQKMQTARMVRTGKNLWFDALEGAWGTKDGVSGVVIGDAAAAFLSSTWAPPKRLGDDPEIAAMVKDLGSRCSFALVARPSVFDPRKPDPVGPPVVVGWGRDAAKAGEAGFGRVEMTYPLARELIRHFSGL